MGSLEVLIDRNIIPADAKIAVLKTGHTVIFPMLYALTKKGGIKWYRVTIEMRNDGPYDIVREKATTFDGKSQTDRTKVTKGVNIGKKNETTPGEQAIFQAQSLISRLRDQGYRTAHDLKLDETDKKFGEETLLKAFGGSHNTDAQGNIKPMLATGDLGKIHYPTYVQPKYNGVRCLAIRQVGGVILLSRKGKRYFIDRVEERLNEIMKVGEIFDGELYSDQLTFQGIVRAVKTQSTKHADQDHIQYIVYDMPGEETWDNRMEALNKIATREKIPLFAGKNKHTYPVALSLTYYAKHSDMLQVKHDRFVEMGYEGTIVRNMDGLYEYGYRSSNLIKKKNFMDEEFKIIDMEEATGRDTGTAVFVLQTKDKKSFNARPEGTKAERTKMWKERRLWIGKEVTVRFQNYSDDGIPIFPVAIPVIRDYE